MSQAVSFFFFLIDFVCLKLGDAKRIVFHLPIHLPSSLSGGESGQSQASRASSRSPVQLMGTQMLGPCPAAFPRPLSGSWITMEQSGLTPALMGDVAALGFIC